VFASGTTGGGSVTLPPERMMLPPTSSPFTAPPATFYGSINGKNNAVHCRARNVDTARTKHIEEDVIRGQPTRENNLSRSQIKHQRRPQKLHADKAYDAGHCRAYLRKRGIKGRIARRGIESSERLGPHRWVLERTLAWLNRPTRHPLRTPRRYIRSFFITRLHPDLLELHSPKGVLLGTLIPYEVT
jgi:hypothetical protein